MASATFKFDVKTPAAAALVADVFGKLKQVWDDQLTDDSVAQYAVALAARGSDQKKLLNNLQTVLGESAKEVVDWCVQQFDAMLLRSISCSSSALPRNPVAGCSRL